MVHETDFDWPFAGLDLWVHPVFFSLAADSLGDGVSFPSRLQPIVSYDTMGNTPRSDAHTHSPPFPVACFPPLAHSPAGSQYLCLLPFCCSLPCLVLTSLLLLTSLSCAYFPSVAHFPSYAYFPVLCLLPFCCSLPFLCLLPCLVLTSLLLLTSLSCASPFVAPPTLPFSFGLFLVPDCVWLFVSQVIKCCFL